MQITNVASYAIEAPYGEMKEFWGEGFWSNSSSKNRSDNNWVDNYNHDWSQGFRQRPVYPDKIYSTVVEIDTNEGVTGIGQCHSPAFPEISKKVVTNVLTPILLGENPLKIDYLWEKMFQSMRMRGHTSGFMMEAISGIDIALWDIKGKALQSPIFELLGGPYRKTLPAYQSHIPIHSAKKMKDKVKKSIANGYNGFQISLSGDPKTDREHIRQVRELAPRETKIMLEGGASLSYSQSLAIGKTLEEFDIHFFEEPLPAENHEGYIKLNQKINIPLAGGESLCTRFGFKDVFDDHYLDVIQPDIGRAGGITECRKIASLANLNHIDYAPHISNDTAIQIVASMHLASAIPNFLIFEHWSGRNPLGDEILIEPISLNDGSLEVPDGPGLGIEIDSDALRKYRRNE